MESRASSASFFHLMRTCLYAGRQYAETRADQERSRTAASSLCAPSTAERWVRGKEVLVTPQESYGEMISKKDFPGPVNKTAQRSCTHESTGTWTSGGRGAGRAGWTLCVGVVARGVHGDRRHR